MKLWVRWTSTITSTTAIQCTNEFSAPHIKLRHVSLLPFLSVPASQCTLIGPSTSTARDVPIERCRPYVRRCARHSDWPGRHTAHACVRVRTHKQLLPDSFLSFPLYSFRPKKNNAILVFDKTSNLNFGWSYVKKQQYLWFKISTIRLVIQYIFIINLFEI